MDDLPHPAVEAFLQVIQPEPGDDICSIEDTLRLLPQNAQYEIGYEAVDRENYDRLSGEIVEARTVDTRDIDGWNIELFVMPDGRSGLAVNSSELHAGMEIIVLEKGAL